MSTAVREQDLEVLLDYLRRKDIERYRTLIGRLGLRR